jgi:hypothetical protein
MLDRKAVKEFVMERLEETGNSPIPKGIKKKELIEAFCQFTEDDYFEWLKDNFASFFNHGNPDWNWIDNYITEHKIGNQ